MKIYEYQAKALLREAGIRVPDGFVVEKPEDMNFPPTVGNGPWMVKAQVLAGGRGKAGGIRRAKNAEELRAAIKEMLGAELATIQTAAEALKIRRLLVERALPVEKELYFAVTLDRSRESLAILASGEGGVEIEELAKTKPEAIVHAWLDPPPSSPPSRARGEGVFMQETERGMVDSLLSGMGLDTGMRPELEEFVARACRLFMEKDCSLLEINPLAISGSHLWALDAKIAFDDSALFRHPEIAALAQVQEEEAPETERRARKAGVNYISLDGEVGCLVNGAGLAMATMDLILLAGGRPANFLDVGGGANLDQVKEAFRILLADRRVRSVLVNIFGGIMKCDLIAQALVEVVRERKDERLPPIVVRLEGTRVEEGRRILEGSGLKISPAPDLTEAARLAVAAAR